MSDRLTQKELRDWSIMAWDDTHIKCQMCGEHSTGLPSKPEQHRPGCPCDKGNVVVSRAELSGAVEWLSVGHSGGTRYEYGCCEWCDATWDTRADHPAPWHLDTCPLYEEPAP